MSTMTLEELRDELENGCLEYIDRQDAVIAIDCAISQLAEIHDALYQSNQKNAALLRERESAKAMATATDKLKEKFEAFLFEEGWLDENDDVDYSRPDIGRMWASYRAALEAVAPMLASARVPDSEWLELADVLDKFTPTGGPGPLWGAGASFAYSYAAKTIRAKLAAAPKPETEE